MSDTTPPLSLRSFNPGWIPAIVVVITCLAAVGSTYFDSQETKGRVKELEVWRASKDVADAQLRVDIGYIKDGIKELREKPPPAVQVYTVQPAPMQMLPQVKTAPP